MRTPPSSSARSLRNSPLSFRTSVAYSSFRRVSRLRHPTCQRLPSVHRDLRYARPIPSQPIACKSSLVVLASDAPNGAAAHRRRRRRTGAVLAASPVGSPLTCVSPPLLALLHFCGPQHCHKQRAERAPPRTSPRLHRTVSHLAVPLIALGCTTALSARSCPLPYRRRRVRGTPTGRASLFFFRPPVLIRSDVQWTSRCWGGLAQGTRTLTLTSDLSVLLACLVLVGSDTSR